MKRIMFTYFDGYYFVFFSEDGLIFLGSRDKFELRGKGGKKGKMIYRFETFERGKPQTKQIGDSFEECLTIRGYDLIEDERLKIFLGD